MRLYRGQGGRGHYSANMAGLALVDGVGRVKVPYKLILIRNRHPEEPGLA